MSDPIQVSFITVNASEHEKLQMCDILGKVPLAELVEILESQWAKEKQWGKVSNSLYQKKLSNGVILQFTVNQETGDVEIGRTISELVENPSNVQQILQQKVKEIADEYNHEVYCVLVETIAKALNNKANSVGLGSPTQPPKITPIDEGYIIDMEMDIVTLQEAI